MLLYLLNSSYYLTPKTAVFALNDSCRYVADWQELTSFTAVYHLLGEIVAYRKIPLALFV